LTIRLVGKRTTQTEFETYQIFYLLLKIIMKRKMKLEDLNIKMFDIDSNGTLKEWLIKFIKYIRGD